MQRTMTGRESQASLFVGRSPCGHRPCLETTKTRRCRWSRQSCLQVEGVTQRPDFQGPRCDRWVSTRRPRPRCPDPLQLSLIHISEPTRRTPISYAVFCLKKKKPVRISQRKRKVTKKKASNDNKHKEDT